MKRVPGVFVMALVWLLTSPMPSFCAASGGISATKNGEEIEGGNKLKWSYKVSIKDIEKKDEEARRVKVRITLADNGSFGQFGDEVPEIMKEGNTYVYSFNVKKDEEEKEIEFSLLGLQRNVKKATISVSVLVDDTIIHEGKIDGPGPRFDPGVVQPVFGGGVSLFLDDASDFETQNDHLIVKNDSRLRGSYLAGLLFKPGSAEHLRLLVSFEFTQNSTKVLDGFAFGLAWRLKSPLHIALGYSIRRSNELRGYPVPIRRPRSRYDKADPRLRGGLFS